MELFWTDTDIYDLSYTHTNNKSQSFSSDIQIKSKHPSGEGRIIGVLCAFDSFITGIWNADQAGVGGGGIIVYPPTITNYSLV